jgi:hypothetical protein
MNSYSRLFLTRSLMTGVASLAFIMVSDASVRADTVYGADGTPGAFCGFDEDCDIDGGDGEPVFAGGNPAVAIGGNGGAAGFGGHVGDGTGNGGNGGSATAVATGGSIVSASATGGTGGGSFPGNAYAGSGGAASATSTAVGGSGGAFSSASATGGFGPNVGGGNATATANASAKMGGRALSEAVATGGEAGSGFPGDASGIANATASAKSSLHRAGVRSTDEALAVSGSDGYGGTNEASANAVAQAAGLGQNFVTPGDAAYAFSTILPDKADVATLIGGASTVADALLGPRNTVFGSAVLGGANLDFASSTFDFAYRGDLLLGLIDGGGEFNVIINGVQILAEDFVDDSVINLGSNFGPNIDLTIVTYGSGDFVLGGAVPESSTWAMMLIGFAGFGYAGYRRAREPRAT